MVSRKQAYAALLSIDPAMMRPPPDPWSGNRYHCYQWYIPPKVFDRIIKGVPAWSDQHSRRLEALILGTSKMKNLPEGTANFLVKVRSDLAVLSDKLKEFNLPVERSNLWIHRGWLYYGVTVGVHTQQLLIRWMNSLMSAAIRGKL